MPDLPFVDNTYMP